MIDREYCVTMAGYNAWMNGKLYALCARLPDAERRAERGAFFGSIERTLGHILAVDEMVLQHLLTGAARFLPQPREYASFEQLRAAHAGLDARISSWALAVTTEWLHERIPFHAGDRVDGTVARGFWLVHWFNHQTHHRGQITTLLSQRGHDIGSTDLHAMLPSPADVSLHSRVRSGGDAA
jgi:uncharacterized damage-inducible protein DinB